MNDSKVTPASRSLTVDILLFALAISVTFPLFLIARELRMGRSDAPRLRTTDTILLAVVAVVTAVLTIWVDAGANRYH